MYVVLSNTHVIGVFFDLEKARKVVEHYAVGFDMAHEYRVFYILVEQMDQKVLLCRWWRNKWYEEQEVDTPKLSPIQEFVISAFREDPMAVDAIKDVLCI